MQTTGITQSFLRGVQPITESGSSCRNSQAMTQTRHQHHESTTTTTTSPQWSTAVEGLQAFYGLDWECTGLEMVLRCCHHGFLWAG